MRYVSFCLRAAAWGVDKLLFLGLTWLMSYFYPVAGLDGRALLGCGLRSACYQAQMPALGAAALHWLIPAAIAVWFLARLGATPGKLVLRARVVDARSGGPLSVRQAWIRVLACPLSYLTGGHLLAIFDARKQALHDKIAGTVVIRPARSTSENG